MSFITSSVYFAADHAGFELKEELIKYAIDLGLNTIDLGTDSTDPTDYTDMAAKLCENIKFDQYGVLICGSGVGMSIKANRFSYIRAALCADARYARLSREHNDANVLVLGSRLIDEDAAKEMFKIFFTTKFQGGRHLLRVQKL